MKELNPYALFLLAPVKIQIIATLVLLCCSFSAMSQQWEVAPHYKEKNTVYIRYGNEGFNNLKTALESIKNTTILKSINMGRLVHINSHDLQKDIMTFMKNKNPELINSALTSAGNLHNPKVIKLKKLFREAVFNSGFFKQINEILNHYGYSIKEISFEKFFIIKDTKPAQFDAMIWLDVKK